MDRHKKKRGGDDWFFFLLGLSGRRYPITRHDRYFLRSARLLSAAGTQMTKQSNFLSYDFRLLDSVCAHSVYASDAPAQSELHSPGC